MEQTEFCARFVAEIMRATAHRTDEPREHFEQYAQAVAPDYFENERHRVEGPEDCARADMDCWD